MNLAWSAIIIAIHAIGSQAVHDACLSSGAATSSLFCYYSHTKDVDGCKCSHVILPDTTPLDQLKAVIDSQSAKVLLSISAFSENLVTLLKSTQLFGLEVQLTSVRTKNDISDFIATIRTKLDGDVFVALSVPAKPEVLAKYYDFKTLSKLTDVFILQTHLLCTSHNTTFHPSRLSGVWDVQNTDSVVDLVTGLGAPLNKLVITSPVQAFEFLLQDQSHTAPGGPALELSTLTRTELCNAIDGNTWTLERDQDQAGPFIFREKKWIAFEDTTSIDIKAKYARVRGLAGLALKDVSQDGGEKCGESLLESAFKGLRKQGRAPRGVVLQSLEREMRKTPVKPFDNVEVSPYRIARLIDTEGKVHVLRKDTRTEFECLRQGYFVHPRSCNRFYRCVKFDQQSDEFNVFEFDCPEGLAFDESVEVCVWPGSLAHGSSCAGSSEIAPVPSDQFICPDDEGYYSDPENCQWFFACLDHGKSPLTPYEFRCPYGLVFDQAKLTCEWSWLVPKCGFGGDVQQQFVYGENAANTPEDRQGNELELYNGLGSLQHIRLGGLTGHLHGTQAKTYSNYNNYTGGLQFEVKGDTSRSVVINPNFKLRSEDLTSHEPSLTGGTVLHERINIGRESISSSTVIPPVVMPDTFKYETYRNLGVVANIHNLQSKQENPTIINLHLHPIMNQHPINGHLPYTGFGSYDASVYSRPQIMVNEGFTYNGQKIEYGAKALQPEPKLAVLKKTFTYHAQPDDSYYRDTQNREDRFTIEKGIVSEAIKHEGYERHFIPPVSLDRTYKEITLQPSTSHQQVHIKPEEKQNAEQEYHEGYHNEKPKIEFNAQGTTSTTPYRVITSQPVQNSNSEKSILNVIQSPEVGTLPSISIYDEIRHEGYHYEKPSIKFEETSLLPERHYEKVTDQPTVTSQQHLKENGYTYPKPIIRFEEKPTTTYQDVTQSYYDKKENPVIPIDTVQQSLIKPTAVIQQNIAHTGYYYEKPEMKFEEKSIHPQMANKDHEVKIQPATAIPQAVKHTGYQYEKPNITFEEEPVVPSKTNYKINLQPAGFAYRYDQPKKKYLVPVNTQQEIKFHPVAKSHQELPITTLEKSHIQSTVPAQQYIIYHHVTPAIKIEERPNPPIATYKEAKADPAIAILKEIKEEGYFYDKPHDKQTYLPVPISPTVSYVPQIVVSSYFYQKPGAIIQQNETYSIHYKTPKISFHANPAIPAIPVVPASTYQKQEGYVYTKPKFVFEEKPTLPLTPVSSYQVQQQLHHYQVPNRQSTETYHKGGYNNDRPSLAYHEVKSLPVQPKPIYTQTNQYIIPKPAILHSFSNNQNTAGYRYDKPIISFEEKSTQSPLPQNPIFKYIPQNPRLQYIPPQPAKTHFPNVTPAPAPVPLKTYISAPLVHSTKLHVPAKPQESYKEIVEQPLLKIKAYQTGYQYNVPAKKFVEPTTPLPTYHSVAKIVAKIEPVPLQFYYYDNRYEHRTVAPPVITTTSTTSKPVARYGSFIINVPDHEYIPASTSKRPAVTSTQRNYVSSTTQRAYLPPNTPRKVYHTIPTTTTEKYEDITLPNIEYLAVTQEIYKIPTSTPIKESIRRPTSTTPTLDKPTREYLPVKSARPSSEKPPVTSTVKPNREYLPARQVENYANGTQVSSTRRPKIVKVIRTRPIIKVDDFHPILATKLGAQCTCTSNTLSLRRQKPQQGKPDSTTRDANLEEYVIPTDGQYSRALNKQSVVILAEDEDEDVNQDDELRRQDIARAVNSGLKLVKSAVRQGVKEGVKEALSSKELVRERGESLQSATECKRAGLFRHPRHCNKFYTCRWDESKKKFSLHVFNCPVHLTFDNNLGACNWPSQGPACVDNTLLTSD